MQLPADLTAALRAEELAFMKGWKVPKRDRGKRVAVEKFGDKSKLDSIDSRVVLISSYY